MTYRFYPITPVPKPRQTRKDKWAKRPSVVRYRAFADEVRLRVREDIQGRRIVFHLPMPKSWTKKKREEMEGQPHMQKPDLDNLAKAFFDALYGDDSHIHEITLMKRWAVEGGIEVMDG